MNDLRHKIHALPKADVHNHLHLGASIKAIKSIHHGKTIKIPKFYNGLEGFIDFILENTPNLMQSSDDVMFLMESAVISCIADNIVYLEASVDIGLTRYFDNEIHKLIETIHQLKSKYASQIDFRPDIGINKDYDMHKVYSDGMECVNSGVFNGIDIYGKEHDKELDGFVEIYELARTRGLKTKVHIGEFSDHKTVENVIQLLNPDELQHGIKAAESEKTMEMIRDQDIRLNICPQSNIALGSTTNIGSHPIRKLYDFGIKVTVNTDDFLLFDASVTDQLIDLLENNIFTYEELKTIIKNGF